MSEEYCEHCGCPKDICCGNHQTKRGGRGGKRMNKQDIEVLKETAFDLGYNWEDLKEALKKPLAAKAITTAIKKVREAGNKNWLTARKCLEFKGFHCNTKNCKLFNCPLNSKQAKKEASK